jgi:hypothetical protein
MTRVMTSATLSDASLMTLDRRYNMVEVEPNNNKPLVDTMMSRRAGRTIYDV